MELPLLFQTNLVVKQEDTFLKKWFSFIMVVAFLSLVMGSLLAATDQPEMYKYKDSKGNWVISSNLPPKYASKGFSIVDNYGRVIEVIPPAKTREEIEADKIREAFQKAEQQKITEQIKLDRDLLRQFTTVKDLQRARNNQLQSVDVEIEIREASTKRSRTLLEKNQTDAANYERQGKPIPKIIAENIEAYLQRIANSNEFIKEREQQKQEIKKNFDSRIARFRELNQQRLRRANIDATQRKEEERYSFSCKDLSECAKAWQLAQLYVNKHSTTGILVITDTLIVTEKPVKNTDISLTFSRIPDRKNKISIHLEVYCNDSPDGTSLCLGNKVKNIKAGFVPYVYEHLKKSAF